MFNQQKHSTKINMSLSQKIDEHHLSGQIKKINLDFPEIRGVHVFCISKYLGRLRRRGLLKKNYATKLWGEFNTCHFLGSFT